jgi:hypothetical protein
LSNRLARNNARFGGNEVELGNAGHSEGHALYVISRIHCCANNSQVNLKSHTYESDHAA